MFENPSLNSIRDGNFLPRYFTEIYYFMLFVGVIGNVITCTVIIKNKFMHTATNYYLLNLAVTDLVILIFAVPCNILIPLKSDLHCQLMYVFFNYNDTRKFFLIHCLGVTFNLFRQLIVRTSMNISVLNVTVLSVERYVGICHPFIASKYTLSSKSRALKIITAIWLIGFLCALPGSLQLRLVPSVNDPTVGACHYVTEVGLYLEGIRSALFFVIPMLIIATTYFLIILSLKSSDKVVRNNNDITERSKRRIPKLLSEMTLSIP